MITPGKVGAVVGAIKGAKGAGKGGRLKGAITGATKGYIQGNPATRKYAKKNPGWAEGIVGKVDRGTDKALEAGRNVRKRADRTTDQVSDFLWGNTEPRFDSFENYTPSSSSSFDLGPEKKPGIIQRAADKIIPSRGMQKSRQFDWDSQDNSNNGGFTGI